MRDKLPFAVLLAVFTLFVSSAASANARTLFSGEALPNVSLPETGGGVFVSPLREDWSLALESNRFSLRTLIVRSGFSQVYAEAIDAVVAEFSPAGGVQYQNSRIYRVPGAVGEVWMLEICGTFSHGLTEQLAIRSIEVIYRDDSAELVRFEDDLPVKAMHIEGVDNNGGGCNICGGILALLPAALFLRRRKA